MSGSMFRETGRVNSGLRKRLRERWGRDFSFLGAAPWIFQCNSQVGPTPPRPTAFRQIDKRLMPVNWASPRKKKGGAGKNYIFTFCIGLHSLPIRLKTEMEKGAQKRNKEKILPNVCKSIYTFQNQRVYLKDLILYVNRFLYLKYRILNS